MKVLGDVKMPRRSTKQSACYDFFAPDDIHLSKGNWTEVDSLVALDGTEAPELLMSRHNSNTGFDEELRLRAVRWVLTLHPRSGQGFKYRVRFANTTGIVDQDYRGHIMCKLTAEEDVIIPKGTAFMQGMFVPFLTLPDEIAPEAMRNGGFGSTDAPAPKRRKKGSQ